MGVLQFNKLQWVDIVVPEDLEMVEKYHIARRKTGENPPTEYEFRIIDKKGNIKDILLKIGMIPHTKKSVASLTDITERKQSENTIKLQLAEITNYYKNIPIGLAVLDCDLRFLKINDMLAQINGIPAEEHINKTVKEIVPDLEVQTLEITAEILRTGEPIKGIEFTGETLAEPGIKHIWMEGWYPLKDDSGKITGFSVIVQDITERKQAEERIKHLNLVLRSIRNINQLIVKEKDREKLLKSVCEILTETRGYHNTWIALLDEEGKLKTGAEAGLGKVFLPMIELLKRGKLTTCSQKALKQQEVVITEDPTSTCTECPLAHNYSGRGAMTVRLKHDGKVYGLMSVSTSAYLAVDQEEQSLFKEVAEDIAFGLYNIELDEEHKQAEQSLKKVKDELQMIIDSVPALIFYKDIEGRIIRANKTLADSLKLSVKDIVGKTTEELFPKEQAENMRKDDKEVIISGEPKMNITEPYDTPEGTRWAITDKMPYKDKEGKVISLISLSKDITFQKRSEQGLQKTYQKLKKTMDATIQTISRIIEAIDPYTAGHQQRVSQLATVIAKELNISQDKIEGIRIASLIHDIGKIGLPTEILSKPTKLTDIEFSLIKDHSQIGYDILKSIDFSYPVAQIVLQHHEKIDGSGYPGGLKGDEILLEAKIICVADVVEAMSSHRPYRPALGIDAALEEISQNKGILYDSKVVDVCLRLFKEKGFKF